MEQTPPSPEIRSLLQRAQSNRLVLRELLEQLPTETWGKPDERGIWTAREHLQHLASIDAVTRDVVEAPGKDEVHLGEAVMVQRRTAMEALAGESLDGLHRCLNESRHAFQECLAALEEEQLARRVVINRPGVWPPEQHVSMRAYLAAWAEHDAEHAAAIRQAATAPLSPTDMAVAARLSRRR